MNSIIFYHRKTLRLAEHEEICMTPGIRQQHRQMVHSEITNDRGLELSTCTQHDMKYTKSTLIACSSQVQLIHKNFLVLYKLVVLISDSSKPEGMTRGEVEVEVKLYT